ncbi:MAG: hypothetical protein ACJAZX_001575 [Rickettsiales bacterium]|jgi:hypothetical protein
MKDQKNHVQKFQAVKMLAAFIILSFFSSCVFLTENKLSQTVDSDNFLNRFPQNNKAIVIFKLKGKLKRRAYLCREGDLNLKQKSFFEEKSKENENDAKVKRISASRRTRNQNHSNEYQYYDIIEEDVFEEDKILISRKKFKINRQVSVDKKVNTDKEFDIKSCKVIYVSGKYHILMLKPDNYYLFSEVKNRPVFSKKISNQEKYFSILKLNSGEILYAGEISYGKKNSKVRGSFESMQDLLSGNNPKKRAELFSNQPWEINFLINNYSSLKGRVRGY